MSVHRQRIEAIQALIAGSVVAASSSFSSIKSEYGEVIHSGKIQPLRRRRILQVLHSTRGLDSTLKEFTNRHGVPVNRQTLGGYLWGLAHHPLKTISRLSDLERGDFQRSIVRTRNRYMHEAGAYPAGDYQVLGLLSDMQACLSRVFSL